MPWVVAYLKQIADCVCAGGTPPVPALPTVATPVFIPIAGAYELPFTISITCATLDAEIHYTTDNSIPTADSPIFDPDNPISILSDTLIQAIGIKLGYNSSDIASAEYTIEIPQAAAPVFSPLPGDYSDTQLVVLTSPNGGSIYYTLDGTGPNSGSIPYTGPIVVTDDTTIRAIAVVGGFSDSPIANGVYTISPLVVATPVFSPAPFAFTGFFDLTITCATPGAAIYYTIVTNGVSTPPDPTPADILYTGTILGLDTDTKVKAKAFKTGYIDSGIAVGHWTIQGTVAVIWGSSTNPLITDSADWEIDFTFDTPPTPLANYPISYSDVPPADGPYRYFIMAGTSDPPSSITQNGFAVSPDDFAQADEGYTSTDGGGFPYVPVVRTGDGLTYRQYRFLNQLFGSFSAGITQ
jgi:hypothetical protein